MRREINLKESPQRGWLLFMFIYYVQTYLDYGYNYLLNLQTSYDFIVANASTATIKGKIIHFQVT